MKESQTMTQAQKEDLLIEWNLYSTSQKKLFLDEFHKIHQESYNEDDFLQFLRHRLEIDGYWKKAGIS